MCARCTAAVASVPIPQKGQASSMPTQGDVFRARSNVCFVDHLDEDSLVEVFIACCIHGYAKDPCNFASTCKRIRSQLVTKHANLYENYRLGVTLRIRPRGSHKQSILKMAYLRQQKLQDMSFEFIKSFIKAERREAMHCASATKCCLKHRMEFNKDSRNAYSIHSLYESTRLVSSAVEPASGNPIHILYTGDPAVRNSKRRIIIKRVCKMVRDGTYCCEYYDTTFELNDLLGTEEMSILNMVASPDGKYVMVQFCASATCCDAIYVLNTLDGTITNMKLTLSLSQLGMHNSNQSSYSRECLFATDAWWVQGDDENNQDDPSSYKLYIGWVSSWFVREDGTKVYPPVDMCGFSVVEHSVTPEKVNEQQVVMWFQRSSCRRVIFNNKCAIVTNQYVDGKFAVVVYDFSAGLGCLRTASVSCLNEPNRMLGQASHELFFNPIHACLSSDKQRLAILCDSCEHFYSSFPSTVKDEFGCDGSMLLIVFTISPCGRFFYRQHSSRDEVWIRYNKHQQSCKKWKLSYSPCESILQVTYDYNKWCIQPQTHYPSSYFVRLTEHGIDRTTPIMNSKVKEISWENPDSIAVSLKYGTVRFVHRKLNLRPF